MTITGRLIFKYLLNKITCTSKRKRMDLFITKKQKTGQINSMHPFHNT